MFRKSRIVIASCLIAIGMVGIGHAETKVLTDCELSTLTSEFAQAQAGDIFYFQEGTCTWSSDVTVPTGVKLIGEGVGRTIIASSQFIKVSLSDDAWIEGIDFQNGLAVGSQGSQDWVVKSCSFGNTTGTRQSIPVNGVNRPEHPTGVFHKCSFEGIRLVIDGKHKGEEEWAQPDDLGGIANTIYIEGCTLDPINLGSGAVGDGNRGGRSVWRFNTFNNGHVQTHGGRGGDSRGFRRGEWYRNTIFRSYNTHYSFWNRGGLIVMFDNNCSGDASGCEYHLDFVRAYSDAYIGGRCSSANPYDNNPHPGTLTDFGCRDATGMGQDIGTSPDLPAHQNPQRYSPGYFWNNKYEDDTGTFYLRNGSDAFVFEDRDFFIDASTHNNYGNGGVTTGLYANRPTCDASREHHGYWAADMGDNWNSSDEWGGVDGALYKCDGDGTWRLYYTPAPYPHPLVKGVDIPSPPTNLTIIK